MTTIPPPVMPIVAPVMPPAPAPRQLPFVRRRYGVEYCTLCDLALDYCLCGANAAGFGPPSEDDAESALVKRIIACRGGR